MTANVVWIAAIIQRPVMRLRTSSSARRSSTSTPAPSAQPAPSARSEYDLQRPSGAMPRMRLNSTKMLGVAMIVAPPTNASEHSLLRSAWQARCRVTSDELHAVSMVIAGPSSPSE